MSKVYSIKRIQQIPLTIAEAWDFFSDPANLATITPQNLGFSIISKHRRKRIYPGQIIEYAVKPVFGIPLYWMTEITHVKDQSYFIDEQRYGPYSFWQHQHHFKPTGAGVEMTDIIYYKIPYWFLGDIGNTLFIKHQLRKIFDYRHNKVDALFSRKMEGKLNQKFEIGNQDQ